VNFGLDEKQVGERVAEAQKPLADQLERLAIQVAREKGVEIAPLRAILVKLGVTVVGDEEIAQIAGVTRGPAKNLQSNAGLPASVSTRKADSTYRMA
jgi:hypothetical protein